MRTHNCKALSSRHKSLAHRLAPWVVAQWLSFVLLTSLQPCCEALAKTIPHEHEAGVHHGHDAHAPIAASATEVPEPKPHEHCGTGDNLKNVVPETLAAPPLPLPEPDPLLHGYAVDCRDRPLPPFKPKTVMERERGPPVPVYLATQRLRI